VHPSVEQAGGVQGRLDPGGIGGGHPVGEPDQAPQRSAGAAFAGGRPGDGGRWGVVAFGGDAGALGGCLLPPRGQIRPVRAQLREPVPAACDAGRGGRGVHLLEGVGGGVADPFDRGGQLGG
jgi:hypothetical protein